MSAGAEAFGEPVVATHGATGPSSRWSCWSRVGPE